MSGKVTILRSGKLVITRPGNITSQSIVEKNTVDQQDCQANVNAMEIVNNQIMNKIKDSGLFPSFTLVNQIFRVDNETITK